MSTKQQIESRREYWKNKKDDFVILLDNWLNHEQKTLAISVDMLYDEYLSMGIEIFELSEYKYGKDLQQWFDYSLASDLKVRKK